MSAHEFSGPRSAGSRIEGLLTWLGGGQWRELAERHERSTHVIAGVIVSLGALLAWLVASLAVSESTRWPVWVIVPLTLVFGLLVGAVIRATVGGPAQGTPGLIHTAGRVAVAIAVGVVVGELAALAAFSGSIDNRLDQHALRNAESTPAVEQASASLEQDRSTRAALDNAIEQARSHLDNALVVARCEYHPTPDCPQTRITGVPGAGPETRTANELLADAQREFDNAVAARDRQAPELDARVGRDQQALTEARQAVVADASRGPGARWVAMNEVTRSSTGALMLRLLTIGFFALLYLLPLILQRWRDETSHERHALARADRERAELERERADLAADTAIAIKRAEVRRAAEIMWAEHQLTQTRLAIEAQAEIDREQQRRRVVEALDAPAHASVQPALQPAEEDIYLPIAAEAEAASLAIEALPASSETASTEAARNLPATAEAGGAVERAQERGAALIPSIPDATRAAARWIRPLVPPFIARAIDTTTAPLYSARQVIEEVEEIAFSFRRSRKVTVNAESSEPAHQAVAGAAAEAPMADGPTGIESSRDYPGHRGTDEALGADPRHSPLHRVAAKDVGGLALEPGEHDDRRALAGRDGPPELPSSDDPAQLPPGQ